MKFSIIIPVYNVEKYIEKCLESLKNLKYKNFEAIIVNDGSKQNEEKIIKKYLKDERFIYIKKENGGISDARNVALDKATGDYLIFLDSDDYLEKDALNKLDNALKNNKVDIVKYSLKSVDEKGKLLNKPRINPFDNLTKEQAIKKILLDEYIDPACMHVCRLEFWKKHKFKFATGLIHEDFGLMIDVLDKAESIISLDYYGYNYVQREASIMSDISYEKQIKKVNDFKTHYLNHKKNLKNKDLLGYVALATIIKGKELNDEDRKEYIKFIKNEKLISKITPISFKRFLMKIYLYVFLEKYLEKLNREFYNEK